MRRQIFALTVCASAATIALACGDDVMTMAGDGLVLAGNAMKNIDAGVSDAAAQSACETCVPAGPSIVVTADTDPAQALGGVARSEYDEWEEIVAGPLFVTDLNFATENGIASFAIAAAGECQSKREAVLHLRYDQQASVIGARMLVKEGQVLCGSTSGMSIRWAGFRPYAAANSAD
jgi:hypothetical protein